MTSFQITLQLLVSKNCFKDHYCKTTEANTYYKMLLVFDEILLEMRQISGRVFWMLGRAVANKLGHWQWQGVMGRYIRSMKFEDWRWFLVGILAIGWIKILRCCVLWKARCVLPVIDFLYSVEWFCRPVTWKLCYVDVSLVGGGNVTWIWVDSVSGWHHYFPTEEGFVGEADEVTNAVSRGRPGRQ